MYNGLLLILFVALAAIAVLIGGTTGRIGDAQDRHSVPEPAMPADEMRPVEPRNGEPRDGIPSIGRVQVLNGCGINDAANLVAEFLRRKGFDVKDVGNAPTWNYPYTLVVSRTADMHNARKVARALSTDKGIMLRASEGLFDVVVYLGADFNERIAD